MLDGIKQTQPTAAPAASRVQAPAPPPPMPVPPSAPAPSPPQEQVQLRHLPAGSSASSLTFPTTDRSQATPEARFEALKQAGKSEEAGALLRQYAHATAPADRAEFANLLKKAGANASLAYLRQEGFIKEAGVFPFDFNKLSQLKAAEVVDLISNLENARPRGQHKAVIAALEAKGATGLSNASEKGAFVRKLLITGKGVETLKGLSDQIKAAPRYTGDLDKAVAVIARKMPDKELKDFFKAVDYYQTGTEGYAETDPTKLKHFSKETIQAFHTNLDEGNWSKYFNFPQRELLSDLKDLL
jgi:hypothetical protein